MTNEELNEELYCEIRTRTRGNITIALIFWRFLQAGLIKLKLPIKIVAFFARNNVNEV